MTEHTEDKWLKTATKRLQSDGFGISEKVTFKDRNYRLVAHRSGFELLKFGNCETFFVFKEFEKLDVESMWLFSADAFSYAKASKKFPLPCGFFESVFCFAIAIVDTLNTAVADSIRRELPAMHWAAAEIRIAYERNSGKLFYFEKTPIWGAAYYKGFRNQISQYLTG